MLGHKTSQQFKIKIILAIFSNHSGMNVEINDRKQENSWTHGNWTIHFFKDFLFYLFDRDSQREREHKQGEWERKKQAPSRGAWCGARPHNTGITPWPEGRRLTAVPPRHPYLFIWEREREREKQRERDMQTPCWAQSPTWASISCLWDHDLNQNQESDAQLSHPGAP